MQIIHSTAELRARACGTARHGAGADHGQPARRTLVAGGNCAQARATSWSRASSSTGCNSLRTRTSPSIPARFERDCELLADSGCDIVFAPSDREVYPEHQGYTVQPPPELAGILEGAVRPDFFTGVCTVVLKLFNMVQPHDGGVRQEGLSATHGDPQHGAAAGVADRDRSRRKPCAIPAAWLCLPATAT